MPNKTNIINLFEQTLRDIILLFLDITGLDMNPEECKQLRRRAWEMLCDSLQINRFTKIEEGRYTTINCNEITYAECTPKSKPFRLT